MLPDDWDDTKAESNMGVVEHEVSHDFFYKHLPSMSGDETSALNEGIATIVQGSTIPPIIFSDPSSENWRDAITDDDPHDAGRHLYLAYKRLSTALDSMQTARNVFLNAIRNFEDIDNNMDASFLEFWGAAIKQTNPDDIVDVIEAFHDLDLLPSESELGMRLGATIAPNNPNRMIPYLLRLRGLVGVPTSRTSLAITFRGTV